MHVLHVERFDRHLDWIPGTSSHEKRLRLQLFQSSKEDTRELSASPCWEEHSFQARINLEYISFSLNSSLLLIFIGLTKEAEKYLSAEPSVSLVDYRKKSDRKCKCCLSDRCLQCTYFHLFFRILSLLALPMVSKTPPSPSSFLLPKSSIYSSRIFYFHQMK